MMRRLIIALLGFILVISSCGCSIIAGNNKIESNSQIRNHDNVEGTNSDTITLTAMYMYDWADNYDWGNDPVSIKLEELTNIKLDFSVPTGSGKEKALMMLMSEDYPDIMWMDRDYVYEEYIQAEALYAVDELAIEYGYDKLFSEYVPADIVKYLRYSDGKLYCIPNEYSEHGELSIGGVFNVRMDIYNYMGAPAISTMDELYDFLVQIKNAGYKYESGNVYPFYINYQMDWLEAFSNVWGGQISDNKYYDDEDDRVYCSIKSENFRTAMAYINRLLREGIMDPESLAYLDSQKKEVWAAGKYVFVVSNFWDMWNANDALKLAEEDIFYGTIPTPQGTPGVRAYMKAYNITGQNVAVITKNNKYPEETIKFFNTFLSPQGQLLQFYGVRGESWDYVDGQPMLNNDVLNGMTNAWDETTLQTGVRMWSLNMFQKYNWEQYQEEEPNKTHRERAEACGFDATALDININPNSEAGIVFSNLYGDDCQIIIAEITQILMAESKDEFNEMYDDMLKKYEEMGISIIEDAWTQAYKANIKK